MIAGARAIGAQCRHRQLPHHTHNVGEMYELGHAVAKDERAAVEWYQKAIVAGHLSTALTLGRLYFEGRGVVKSQAEALKYFRKAAEAQDVEAVWGHVRWVLDYPEFGLTRAPYETSTVMLLTLAEYPKYHQRLMADAPEVPEPVRIAVQKRLKQAGLFRGRVNGNFGTRHKEST
jgi:TPR repeat protein